jgi:hypothetical protein
LINNSQSVQVAGFPWLPLGGTREISPSALTAKVLCKRHNEVLSSLDDLAKDFFEFLKEDIPRKPLMLVNGFELERWMLKLLCGLASSGNLSFNSEQLRDWNPPSRWLQVLFGSESTLGVSGLHLIVSEHRFVSDGIAIKAARDPQSGAIELALLIERIPFIFSMESQLGASVPRNVNMDLCRRPQAIQIRSLRGVREIHFGWLEGRVVTIEVEPYNIS